MRNGSDSRTPVVGQWHGHVQGIARRLTIVAAAAVFLSLCLYGTALLLAEPLLTVRTLPKRTDVIVVLGGDGPSRASHAAKLWTAGLAPSVLVVGRGDCGFIRRRLIDDGVAPDVITLECESASTWQNAQFSQPILLDRQVRNAILVTSWFHSRRAINRFRSLMPNIDWVSVPTQRAKPLWKLAFETHGVYIAKEYVKIVAYDIRSRAAALMDATASGVPLSGSKR